MKSVVISVVKTAVKPVVKIWPAIGIIFLTSFCIPSWALNIVLTNDDSWRTENIKALKKHLVDAGHDVILSTPCTQQSGKGGAIGILKTFPVDDSRRDQQEYCVGDTDDSKPYKDFRQGTPVMAALYGIDKLAMQYWNKKPDLLISGPNEGNNMGVLNNNSGTLGAAMVAIGRGIPAMAISAHESSMYDHSQAPRIASAVLKIVTELEATCKQGQPLLPQFTGLNINFPQALAPNTAHKFTRVGWSAGYEIHHTDDLSKEEFLMELATEMLMASGKIDNKQQAQKVILAKYQGVHGFSFRKGNLGDASTLSEANVLKEGYITISTIDANVQASNAKAKLVKRRLKALD